MPRAPRPIPVIERAIRERPDDGDLRVELGRALLDDGRVPEALVALAQGHGRYAMAFVEPRATHATLALTYRVLEQHLGSRRALDAYRAACDAGDPRAHYDYLMRSIHLCGVFPNAVIPYEELDDVARSVEGALAEDADDPGARFRRAIVRAYRGELEDAMSDLRRCLEVTTDARVASSRPDRVLLLLSALVEGTAPSPKQLRSSPTPDRFARLVAAGWSEAEARERVATEQTVDEVVVVLTKARRAEPSVAAQVEGGAEPPPQVHHTGSYRAAVFFGHVKTDVDSRLGPDAEPGEWESVFRRNAPSTSISEVGCAIGRYGKLENFQKHYVSITDSEVWAWDARPARGLSFDVDPAWIPRLERFCEIMGIDADGPPGWCMAVAVED